MLTSGSVMKSYVLLVIVAVTATTLAGAIPKPDEQDNTVNGHKNRIHEKELSDQDHFEHDGEEHNPDYDHEAFLGKEEAKTFDELTPDESKERLGIIYDKIDKDKDGEVTEEELKAWIKYVQNRYIMEDTERQWKEHEADVENEHLSWEAYRKKTYGFLDEEAPEEEEGGYSYRDMLRRDERRWKKADTNDDTSLSKEEFANFLHPEEAPHMREVVVDETLEDIDKDKDGVISLEEYVADMWPQKDTNEEEPEWVKTEREQFASYRDKNSDGQMDRGEVQDWIIPPDYDHSEAEARHLIHESDHDRDEKLSKDEVLSKYDLFVGSQATDFGEALTRHDEF